MQNESILSKKKIASLLQHNGVEPQYRLKLTFAILGCGQTVDQEPQSSGEKQQRDLTGSFAQSSNLKLSFSNLSQSEGTQDLKSRQKIDNLW